MSKMIINKEPYMLYINPFHGSKDELKVAIKRVQVQLLI